jgi:uncharacterized protein YneF (UPF0154 family)
MAEVKLPVYVGSWVVQENISGLHENPEITQESKVKYMSKYVNIKRSENKHRNM